MGYMLSTEDSSCVAVDDICMDYMLLHAMYWRYLMYGYMLSTEDSLCGNVSPSEESTFVALCFLL